jgi:hypothetical protein
VLTSAHQFHKRVVAPSISCSKFSLERSSPFAFSLDQSLSIPQLSPRPIMQSNPLGHYIINCEQPSNICNHQAPLFSPALRRNLSKYLPTKPTTLCLFKNSDVSSGILSSLVNNNSAIYFLRLFNKLRWEFLHHQ